MFDRSMHNITAKTLMSLTQIKRMSPMKLITIAILVMSLCLADLGMGHSKTIALDLGSLEAIEPTRNSDNASDSLEQTSDVKSSGADALSIELTAPEESTIPYDTCLPGLYRDWLEYSLDHDEFRKNHGIVGAQILIDRKKYQIRIQALLKDGTNRESYRGPVALGALKSPTPRGRFIINHIYCYPDVIFFASESQPVADLYMGFFAPLQICDESGHCERYNELGLHGFQLSAHPNPATVQPGLYGAVSGGCVRIADPCSIKRHLIRLVGVGNIRKNDRGSFHWLRKNVEVVVFDEESEPDETLTLAKILEEGIMSLGSGLRSVMNIFEP